MKLNYSSIFLALGLTVSFAGPLHAAESRGDPQSQSSMPAGMTNDTAQQHYQDALDKCNKKTGAAKSRCMKNAAEAKCKDMSGSAKSACMKDATKTHPGASGGASGMPDNAPMDTPAEGSSGPSGSQTGSPNGSYK